MTIYVFGNQDIPEDNAVFTVTRKLQKSFPQINFIFVPPNQDLPFTGQAHVILLDTVRGLSEATLLTEADIDKLSVNKSVTAHDYDLGFQLKYLKKLNKLGKVTIIGVPQNAQVNYERIQSIVRKLVAQDMQGS